jgi:hypothetical protein
VAIKDAPDGTLWVQQVSVVVAYPTPSEPAMETPVAEVGRYPGSDTVSYHELASWTVAAGKLGELMELSLTSDALDDTYFKIEIGTLTISDLKIGAPLTIPFNALKLAEAVTIRLSAKSSAGAAIVADGSITGKEIG